MICTKRLLRNLNKENKELNQKLEEKVKFYSYITKQVFPFILTLNFRLKS